MPESPRILVVDDDAAIRDLLAEGLGAHGYSVSTAADVDAARGLFHRAGAFDLVLCDLNMPGSSGQELLGWLKQRDPDVAVIMVTGVAEAQVAVGCMRDGAADYVVKPFHLPEVLTRVAQALDRRRLVIENRAYQQNLEVLVGERTREVVQAMARIRTLHEELRGAYDATLSALMIALDYRDFETQGHSIRVVEYTERLAREMGIDEPELTDIRRGTMLHDVGKIGIPDSILRKPGPLDEQEWEIMKTHAELGYRMLKDIPFLAGPAEIVLAHQEKWDGSGYPRGLRGPEIPLGARIFSVADTFDAMTSDRPYRKALSYERARQEIIDFSGRQFDPRVVEAFLEVPPEEWDEIRAHVERVLSERSSPGMPEPLADRVKVG
ncbi:MAG: response regulator [Acidobacteria bacterium]|nr:MAG: response regulator [Acidobacteriota bacterium]